MRTKTTERYERGTLKWWKDFGKVFAQKDKISFRSDGVVVIKNPEMHACKLLIKRLFPTPLAGYEHTLVLFKICRELGDQYCLSFDEKGYTADYKPFDSEEVIEKAVRLLTDDRLPSYVERYKDKLARSDFRGKYYTYDHKTKRLKLESEWEKIESELKGLFKEYGKGGKAVCMHAIGIFFNPSEFDRVLRISVVG